MRQLDWVVSVAADFDLVVLAGDHLDLSSVTPLSAQTIVIAEYLKMLGEAATVLVCSGNHDLTGPDAHGEQAAEWLLGNTSARVVTDGGSLDLGDTLITVCKWWDGPKGRELVAEQLANDARRRPARWIWIYHWPPVDSPTSWTGKRHYGDQDLAGWITEHQPDMVLCGHVHQPPFTPGGSWADRIGHTWVFNAGTQIGPVPPRIEFDLASGDAVWVSLLGSESLNLNDAVVPERSVL